MAIKIGGYQPSSIIGHIDGRGKACPGVFQFPNKVLSLKEALVELTDRKCSHCGRLETYEADQVIIVGKAGVAQNVLIKFCMTLLVYLESERKKYPPAQTPASKETKILSVTTDASNQLRPAVIMQIEKAGLPLGDPTDFVRDIASKIAERLPQGAAYDEVVDVVWRKPVAYRSGEVIPYK